MCLLSPTSPPLSPSLYHQTARTDSSSPPLPDGVAPEPRGLHHRLGRRLVAAQLDPRQHARGTGEWHVYTTVFDHRRSEIYVDGYCEASGKSAGGNALDGLSLGCDHNGVFFLNGSIAELRLFHAHLPAPQRVQIEAALAQRYGISYSFAMQMSPPGRGSFPWPLLVRAAVAERAHERVLLIVLRRRSCEERRHLGGRG